MARFLKELSSRLPVSPHDASYMGDQPMVPSEEVMRHAAECEYMAEFLHDPKSRDAWIRMA